MQKMMDGMNFKKRFYKMEIFNLPKVLNLVEASSLLDSFIKMKSSNIKIDASNVVQIGAQCMQILIAAKNNWQENNFDFILENPSKEFLESMLTIGIIDDDLTYHRQNIDGEFKL